MTSQDLQPGCEWHPTHSEDCTFCLESQDEATRDFLKRQLGRHIGLNADWSFAAWHIYVDGEDRYLLDMEDGTYDVVTRKYREDDNDEIESVESFPESQLVEWVMRYKQGAQPMTDAEIERERREFAESQEHPCDACGVPVPEDEHLGHDKPNGDTEYLCEDCFNECWNPCDGCGTMTEMAQTKGNPGSGAWIWGEGAWICEDCFQSRADFSRWNLGGNIFVQGQTLPSGHVVVWYPEDNPFYDKPTLCVFTSEDTEWIQPLLERDCKDIAEARAILAAWKETQD